MRGDGRGTWRLQFDRRVRATNRQFEWAHNPAAGSTDTTIYSGYLQNMGIAARTTRTKPRLSVYTLGEIADSQAGGSTSRMGADLSLPITSTSSFEATFHPDYSNVELDQQTISPTAFPRRFSEVRPFFTQQQNFFNNFNCNDCLDYPLLYTPAVPTPRDGYAMEGKQGQFSFAGFDSISDGRDDNAQALTWKTDDRHFQFLYQREDVNLPGVADDTQYLQSVVGNGHNFNVYSTLGNESGTQVSDPGEGRYGEFGLNLYTPKEGIYAAYHDIGPEYAPIDGFNQINGVHGPTVYVQREFDNGPHAYVQSVIASQDFGDMEDSSGVTNYAYNSSYVTVQTRDAWFLGVSAGDQYIRFPGQPGGFTNQDGIQLFHGQNTSTPNGFSYDFGRYGQGYLTSIDVQDAIRLTRLGTLSTELFETRDAMDSGGALTQCLERVSLGYQISPGQSLAVGWRRIIGTTPPFFTPLQYIDATNLSLAYYRRWSGNELYLAFGDPNQLATQHDWILKLIRYFGADKGV